MKKNNIFVIIYGERVNENPLPLKDAIDLAVEKARETQGTVFLKDDRGNNIVDEHGVPYTFH